MEAVHHLEVAPQVLLGQMVEHPGVHQTLHKVGAVLREAQARQPLVADPLVIHVAVGQSLQARRKRRLEYRRMPFTQGTEMCQKKSNISELNI